MAGNSTSRTLLLTRHAQGLGVFLPYIPFTGAAVTVGNSGCGFFSTLIHPNSIGSTLPDTLQSLPLPPALSAELRLAVASYSASVAASYWLVYLYEFGTVVFTATGNQFTHHAATFPALRTQFGVASQPLTLIPFLQITTATTTTQAVFRLRNTTGPAAGYVNQAGTSQIGNKDITLPAAATLINSCYVLPLNTDDSGVRDITQIDVTTAATAGAGRVFGLEILAPLAVPFSTLPSLIDLAFGGIILPDVAPALATLGTLASTLLIVEIGSATAAISTVHIHGTLD